MICDTCIHKEVCYEKEEDRQALKFCSDYFNFVEELEKIKAEIKEDKKLYSFNEHIQKGHSICIDIVNSHISELKGENNEGKRICRNCKNFYEYDSVFDEEDNEDYFTLFCKVKGEVREPDEEIADKCKDFVLKGENND